MRLNVCTHPLATVPAVLVMPDWIIPTLIGVAASAIFFWLGMRFRSKSGMAYQLHDFTVIGQPSVTNLGDIKILFNKVAVPRVVVTQLAVWNTGNTVVRGNEIVESDPLAIRFEDGALILHAQRVNATQEVNDFRIRISEQDRSRAFLEFDYLNGRDGAKFQIIHTGAADKAKLTGSIRGIPKGVENWGDLREWSEQKSRLFNSGSGLLIPFACVILLMILTWVKSLIAPHFPAINRFTEWLAGAFAVLGVLLFLFLFLFVLAHSIHTRSRATPKSLSRH
jgi:hypothetical protein